MQTIIVFIVPDLILQNYGIQDFTYGKNKVTLHKMMMNCLFQVMNRHIHLNAAILRFRCGFGGLV
ncbi:MAG: hypothetical protein ACN6OJ_11750 [Chryseobacterium sp.]|uniref:hypothetical protein n=1 Tax=Chryseobacterium sp. TaxID=1871047 RepID=UPI003D10A4BA